MSDKVKKAFEAWWKDQKCPNDPVVIYASFISWVAGRESMREEAMDVCEQHWSAERIAQKCYVAIKELP